MTAFRVATTSAAARDIVRAKEWLTQPGAGTIARRTLSALFAAIRALRQDHHRWPASDHSGLRERKVDGYVIVYRVEPGDKVVRVLRVFSPFQDQSVL